jgi:CheY-like chemotaxis protein
VQPPVALRIRARCRRRPIEKAIDGADAIAVYARSKEIVSVGLVDMMMPGMDGKQTAQVILRLNPEVKIIATSGMETTASVRGVTRFLAKPFTAGTL